MSVAVRKYVYVNPQLGTRSEGWEVDVSFAWPDGTKFRKRLRAPVNTEKQAQRWGEDLERRVFAEGKESSLARSKRARPAPVSAMKEVPTLEEFSPRFVNGYSRAEQQKASGVATKERILRLHLLPMLGHKRLDQISNEDIAHLKAAKSGLKRKTVNNIVNVLSKLLNVAIDWGVISTRPCTVKLLKVEKTTAKFYDFDEYATLIGAARGIDHRVYLMTLLGGDAGLRRGEMIALRWQDVDLKQRQLKIERSMWQGVEDTPKGGNGRVVEMTSALAEALRAHRHLRGPRVLCQDDGRDVDENILQDWIEQATSRAGLAVTRGVHILRHTFCSHLAMRGAGIKSIQELAGHEDIKVTERYMHLSPSAKRDAIALLDRRGESLENASGARVK